MIGHFVRRIADYGFKECALVSERLMRKLLDNLHQWCLNERRRHSIDYNLFSIYSLLIGAFVLVVLVKLR